jgi:hypothetical protein
MKDRYIANTIRRHFCLFKSHLNNSFFDRERRIARQGANGRERHCELRTRLRDEPDFERYLCGLD